MIYVPVCGQKDIFDKKQTPHPPESKPPELFYRKLLTMLECFIVTFYVDINTLYDEK
jgi:hypothetical protein